MIRRTITRLAHLPTGGARSYFINRKPQRRSFRLPRSERMRGGFPRREGREYFVRRTPHLRVRRARQIPTPLSRQTFSGPRRIRFSVLISHVDDRMIFASGKIALCAFRIFPRSTRHVFPPLMKIVETERDAAVGEKQASRARAAAGQPRDNRLGSVCVRRL